MALVALLLLVGLALAALIRAVVSSFEHTSVVCVTYRGRTVCREAVGSTRDDASRIALQRACDFVTADAQAYADCLQAGPDSVEFPMD